VDLRVSVGAVELPNPVLCASGTAGYGTELAGVMDLTAPGAVVVKSLSAEPWPGNPAPRVDATPAGMINSVGLQGPGVAAWAAEQLPALRAAGVRVVASIWGRTVEEYRRAAELLAPHRDGILALEVNLSCPNLEGGEHLFARAPESAAAATEAAAMTSSCGVRVRVRLRRSSSGSMRLPLASAWFRKSVQKPQTSSAGIASPSPWESGTV